MSPLSALLLRDLRLAVRLGGGALVGVLFFLIVVTLVPFAVGPDLALLTRIGPAMLWLGALLATLLGLDRLLASDHEDGSLDLLLTGRMPLELALATKALAHWLVTGLPLLLAAAPLAIMLRMPDVAIPTLLTGLVPGTLLLSLLGTTGAAIVLGARRGGVLLPLLILPLTTPVLIFGVAAADAVSEGMSPRPHLLLLAAFLAAALPLCPLAAGAGLRNAVE